MDWSSLGSSSQKTGKGDKEVWCGKPELGLCHLELMGAAYDSQLQSSLVPLGEASVDRDVDKPQATWPHLHYWVPYPLCRAPD